MISVKKDFATLPDKFSASKRLTLILDSVTTRNNHAFDSKVYRDTTLEALEILYNFKCAYCETDTSAGAPMQVEHYRPKAKVAEDKAHLGYYWLTYEWSNLTLSCSKCNRSKSNHFPIVGDRIQKPLLDANGYPTADYNLVNSDVLINEQAFLLHPELDVIEDEFLFNKIGEIEGKTKRALETIKICNLNRKDLRLKRLGILNKFTGKIKRVLTDYLNKEIGDAECRYSMKLIFEELSLLQDPKKQYSRFGYFLFYKFDLFIADSLDEKQSHAIRILFEQFKNKTL